MSIGMNLTLFIFLLAATAFFVASEFAIVRIRRSRLDQLVDEGNIKATLVKDVTKNLDGYLAACQLGITVTALGLGWLGEPTVERLLHPAFEALNIPGQVITPLSFLIAFALVTFLHVVIGELAPKTIAIQKPEEVSFFIVRMLRFFYKVAYPVIFVLNGVANRLVRLFGIHPATEADAAHTEEELQILMSESLKHGEINQAEYGYVSNIFAFDERKAHEIMVPRTDMICIERDEPVEASMKKILDKRFTRFPVIGDNKDDIIGFINTKQFLLVNAENEKIDMHKITRPVLNVSDQTPIKRLLRKMQNEGIHLVILIDEYGGTAGMLTIEDILEEIVGDIRDEFDENEVPEFEKITENHFLLDGKMLIDDLNHYLPASLPEDEFDTISGWLFGQNPNIREGQKWVTDSMEVRVLKRDNHRYRKLEIILPKPETK